jgi:phosphatidylinositol alpha 1,6-mannosyltransferase
MNAAPRVAFFTDSFHEVNGVAHTSRHFDAFVRRRGLPFLNVHAGPQTVLSDDGPVWQLELHRGPIGFQLENDMSFDVAFLRHKNQVKQHLKKFGAELIHITGPSDVGILGALLAHELSLPLMASWHTNIHEFAARRLSEMLAWTPGNFALKTASYAERDAVLPLTIRFYKLARVLLAPNLELVEMLQERSGRPVFLMQRGVDTVLFSPKKRDCREGALTIGYVGRLSPEKSVRVLRDIERALLKAGIGDFRIQIVGDGHERSWLAENIRNVQFTGVLHGEDLARAYAGMDIFAFPSHTDTFGNVVLEALASGVPTVVTASGGPKYLVTHGVTGLIAADEASFLRHVETLARDGDLRQRMGLRAREFALCRYWDRIFEQVYDAYDYCLRANRASAARQPARASKRSFASG